ncbi:MAG: type II secretion system protein GspG [Phycisphaeraceae bacterium]
MNMVHLTTRRTLAVSFIMLLLAAVTVRAQDAKPQAAKGSGPNLRVVEVSEEITRLDMAVKFFASPDGKGPTVALVSAIHIADPSFYEFAQKLLDSQDLVLFEGVGPGHAPDKDSPKGRAAMTSSRVRYVAVMLERYKALKKDYPAALADLIGIVGEGERVKRDRLNRALKDAWNHSLAYEKFAAGFTLTSLGADGKVGGDGENVDLAYADQDPLTKEEIDDQGGIQNDLAEALGLTFQLHAVDTGKGNYRNADISLDSLKAKLGDEEGQAGDLLKMMDGSSSMAGMVKMALGMIRGNPKMQMTFKAIIMDLLAAVGDDMTKMANLQPGMQGLMKVLIDERNQVVVDSLKAELSKDKPAATIALWYGAGHMKDLENRLVDQLDYKYVASFWLPAITLDLTGTAVKKADMQAMRSLMKTMLESMKNRK